MTAFTLRPGELPASGARLLTGAQRHALVSALGHGLARERDGWRNHHSSAVKHQTVQRLAAEGYIVLVRRTGERRPRAARLTARGDWYARTLIAQAKG